MKRAKLAGLKRNAAVVLRNLRNPDDVPALEAREAREARKASERVVMAQD